MHNIFVKNVASTERISSQAISLATLMFRKQLCISIAYNTQSPYVGERVIREIVTFFSTLGADSNSLILSCAPCLSLKLAYMRSMLPFVSGGHFAMHKIMSCLELHGLSSGARSQVCWKRIRTFDITYVVLAHYRNVLQVAAVLVSVGEVSSVRSCLHL